MNKQIGARKAARNRGQIQQPVDNKRRLRDGTVIDRVSIHDEGAVIIGEYPDGTPLMMTIAPDALTKLGLL